MNALSRHLYVALLFCPMTFIMYSYVSDGLKAKPPASACMNIVDLLSLQHLSLNWSSHYNVRYLVRNWFILTSWDDFMQPKRQRSVSRMVADIYHIFPSVQLFDLFWGNCIYLQKNNHNIYIYIFVYSYHLIYMSYISDIALRLRRWWHGGLRGAGTRKGPWCQAPLEGQICGVMRDRNLYIHPLSIENIWRQHDIPNFIGDLYIYIFIIYISFTEDISSDIDHLTMDMNKITNSDSWDPTNEQSQFSQRNKNCHCRRGDRFLQGQ